MADLRLVSDNEEPVAPLIAVETFTFVKGKSAVMIYRDGRLVDFQTAVDAFALLMREAFDKREALMNEMASTPRGML